MAQLTKYLNEYESWVAENPETVVDLETTARWVSYFLGGRFSNSNFVSELVYASSNLLSFYNDRIIDKARGALAEETATAKHELCYRVKVMLTTLEYCEVMIELSARRWLGTRGKWLVIGLVQLTKAAGRMYLLQNSSVKLLTTPPIKALNRRKLIKEQKACNGGLQPVKFSIKVNEHVQLAPEDATTYQLKRSGRLMRKVEGAPPAQYRDFKLTPDTTVNQRTGSEETSKGAEFLRHFRFAEYLHIAKPLIHLAAMGVFGERNWPQLSIALASDLASLHLYYQKRYQLNAAQRLELSRRCFGLAIYLARSPLYERFSKSRIDSLLNFVECLPLAGLVARPIRECIPHWQRTYFYLWSS